MATHNALPGVEARSLTLVIGCWHASRDRAQNEATRHTILLFVYLQLHL